MWPWLHISSISHMYFTEHFGPEKRHAIGRTTVYQSRNAGQYLQLLLMRIYPIFFVVFIFRGR
jgi:hypothetical protein